MKKFFKSLSTLEKRNCIFYILGIMLLKLGFDATTICFDDIIKKKSDRGNIYWIYALVGNYLFQCFGSLMVTPLIKKFSIHRVLAVSVFFLGFVFSIFPFFAWLYSGFPKTDADPFNLNVLVVSVCIFVFSGFFLGLVDLIRRVIPQMLVGNDCKRLKSLDSLVHMFYEVSGTVGPILFHQIQNFTGKTYVIIPFCVLCFISCFFWLLLVLDTPVSVGHSSGGIFSEFRDVFFSFFTSIAHGCSLVLRSRSLIWLIPAYSLPLVLHRYLEGVFLGHFSRIRFNDHSTRYYMTAGSNLGEFCGALFILLFVNLVKTPIPWIRLDAITLFAVWIFYSVPNGLNGADNKLALLGVSLLCSGISFGWASGDVSIVAYIQSHLGKLDNSSKHHSPLGSVMSFLYVCYILMFVLISTPINLYADHIKSKYKKIDTPADIKNKQQADDSILFYSCIAFSACAIVISLATFVPKNSFSWNPKSLDFVEDSDENPDKVQNPASDEPLKP